MTYTVSSGALNSAIPYHTSQPAITSVTYLPRLLAMNQSQRDGKLIWPWCIVAAAEIQTRSYDHHESGSLVHLLLQVWFSKFTD